jgi:hypothetical protein
MYVGLFASEVVDGCRLANLFQSFAIPHILPTGPGRKSVLVEGFRLVSDLGIRPQRLRYTESQPSGTSS